MEFRFGPWLPDGIDYKNPGLEECKNVIPQPTGYKPARAAEGTGDSVSGTVIGAAGYERSDGTAVVVVGTTSDLYTIVNSTVAASSLSLSLSATDRFVFELFGEDIYATVKGGDTYRLADVDSGTTFSASAGSPPDALAMGRIGDFLAMGNLTDIDASDQPYRLRWSQFNNGTGTWGTDIATQSGYVDFPDLYGPIQAISGGSVGIVFQKFGVSRVIYTGGATVFRRETFEKERGCAAPQSVVTVGNRAFFLSLDGFFVTDGSSVQPVSTTRVFEWFLDNVEQSLIDQVQGAVDWENRCVVWACPDEDGNMTQQLWYCWETQTWSRVVQTIDFLVATSRTGTSLEDLATTYPDLDAMTISLDSPIFRASGRTVSGFVSGELNNLSGSPLQAEFESGDFQPVEGMRSFISEVVPLVENENEDTEVRLGLRDRMLRTPTYTTWTTIGPLGYAATDGDGRYFRVGVRVPSGSEWGSAFGFQVNAIPSGEW